MVVRVGSDVLEYLVLSDSVLLVEGVDGVHVLTDTRLDDLRADLARRGSRWDAIRACGWELERVLDHHMRDHAAAALAKVRATLVRRGWPIGS